MTISDARADERLIWSCRWPGKLGGGKTHIFVTISGTSPGPPQWYERELPPWQRGRANTICGLGTGDVGLQVRPTEWKEVGCKRCSKLLRKHLLLMLAG